MSHNSTYQHLGTAAIRIPLFSWETGNRIIRSLREVMENAIPICSLENGELAGEWQVVLDALYVGSPSLYAAYQSHSHKSAYDQQTLRLVRSLQKFVNRMFTRPTPFGLFAGLGIVSISPETHLQISQPHEHTAVTRMDWGWVSPLIEHLENDQDIVARLPFRFSKSTWSVSDRLYCLKDDYTEVSIRHTDPIQLLQSVAREWIKLDQLVKIVNSHWPCTPKESIQEMLGTLRRNGFLVSALRMSSSSGRDPLDHITKILAEYLEPESRLLQDISDIQHGLELLNQLPLGQKRDHLNGLKQKADSIVQLSGSDPLFQTDLSVGMNRYELAESVGHRAAIAASILYRLRPNQDGFPHLDVYRRQFHDVYGQDVEVPLLELLDSRSGLGPPPTYNRPEPNRSWEPPNLFINHRRHEVLLGVLLESVRQNGSKRMLDDRLLAKLEISSAWEQKAADSCDLFFSLAEEDGCELVVVSPTGGNYTAGKALGRFSHLFPNEIGQLLNEVKEHRLRTDTVQAETTIYPSSRVQGNVTLRASCYDFEVIGASPPSEYITSIPLSEIVVGVTSQNRFYIRSPRCGKLIRCTETHRFNNMYSHNVWRFLDEIDREDSYFSVFDWGSLAGSSFLPRIQYQDIVVSRAKWTIAPTSQNDQAANIAQFLRIWNVPPIVYEQQSGDVLINRDLRDPNQISQIERSLAQGRSVTLLESIGNPSSSIVEDEKQEHFHAEFVVPLVKQRGDSLPQTSVPAVQRDSSELKNPDGRVFYAPFSPYLYLKLYCDDSLHNRVIYEISGILNSLDSVPQDSWFHMRYRDPEPHVRIRIRGVAENLYGQVLRSLSPWYQSLMDSRGIKRVSIDTYVPELERYGGIEGIQVAEGVFSIDSRYAIQITTAMDDLELDKAKLILVLHSSIWFARALVGFTAEFWRSLDILSGTNDSRLSEFRKNYSDMRVDIRQAFRNAFETHLGNLRESTDSGTEQLLKRRDADLVGFLSQNETPSELMLKIASSLLHMHLNRLMGVNRAEEVRILYLIGRGYRDYSHMKST